MPHSSAAASSWQFQHIIETNRTHVGKSAFERSNTVPVSDPYLRPHARHSHLCDPAADLPSRTGLPPSPQRGHPGAGLKASAASSKVPQPWASRQALASTAADSRAKSSEPSAATRPA